MLPLRGESAMQPTPLCIDHRGPIKCRVGKMKNQYDEIGALEKYTGCRCQENLEGQVGFFMQVTFKRVVFESGGKWELG